MAIVVIPDELRTVADIMAAAAITRHAPTADGSGNPVSTYLLTMPGFPATVVDADSDYTRVTHRMKLHHCVPTDPHQSGTVLEIEWDSEATGSGYLSNHNPDLPATADWNDNVTAVWNTLTTPIAAV